MTTVTIGSLFSGIGGLDLGLEAALAEANLGPRVTWQVETDPFCRAVLTKHWPSSDRSVTDVRAASATVLPQVDIICGGFPCQDVSGAGKGAGLSGERSGLWWEYLRVVRELRPRVVLIENVASGLRRWLEPVCCSLAQAGYRTQARQISAADVGAPHRRERVFVVAYTDSIGRVEPERRQCDERGRFAHSGLGACSAFIGCARPAIFVDPRANGPVCAKCRSWFNGVVADTHGDAVRLSERRSSGTRRRCPQGACLPWR